MEDIIVEPAQYTIRTVLITGEDHAGIITLIGGLLHHPGIMVDSDITVWQIDHLVVIRHIVLIIILITIQIIIEDDR